MNRYNFKQIAWRVIAALILLALLIDRAMMLLEMSNTHFIDIFIPTAIMVGVLAVFVLFIAYIKCCAVKVPTDKK